MHTPDGFLHPWMVVLFIGLSSLTLVFAATWVRSDLTERRIHLFGIVTAGIFAAQLLNWPIPGGTSAHFVGGALAAIVLGPHLGALSVALVLTIQAFVFGDGGVFALGANVWSMAIVEVYAGYAVYHTVSDRSESLAVVCAGWVGITLAAVSTGIQLGLSPAFDYSLLTVLTVMVGGHALLGIGEGLLTLVGARLLAESPLSRETNTSIQEINA